MEENNKLALALAWTVAGVTGVLQLSSILIQDVVPPARKITAAVCIAVFVGVSAALLMYIHFHVNAIVSGIAGGLTGLVPAARWIAVATAAVEQHAQEKLKLKLEEEIKQKQEVKEGGA